MSISVVARGRIVSEPAEISSDRGPLSIFVLGDAQFGIYQGEEHPIDDLQVLEVCCRGDFAKHALNELTIDLPVIVVGSARISRPLDFGDDRDLVYLTIEAETVGIDLAHRNDWRKAA